MGGQITLKVKNLKQEYTVLSHTVSRNSGVVSLGGSDLGLKKLQVRHRPDWG